MALMKHHLALSTRVADNLDPKRYHVTREETLSLYMSIVELQKEYGVFALEMIFNLDEDVLD